MKAVAKISWAVAIVVAVGRVSGEDALGPVSGGAAVAPTGGGLATLSSTDFYEIKSYSDAEFRAFLGLLAETPTLAPDQLPRGGGGYFSLQHPNWPPLPVDINRNRVWQADGIFILDDVDFDYAAAGKARVQAVTPATAAPAGQTVAAARTVKADGLVGGVPQPVLTITPAESNQVVVSIINGVTNITYDVDTTPVLGNFAASLEISSVIGTNSQTNFTFNLGPYFTGFYRAVVDTNNLYKLANPTNPAAGYLTVFIDSPTNGTVLQ